MDEVTTDQAAARLGVSRQEVLRLINQGALPARRVGRMFLVHPTPLAARERVRPGRGRPFAARVAWAALWEIGGQAADWLSRSQRSRLRSWLRDHDAADVALACRKRAHVHDLRILPAYLERLSTSSGTVRTGMSVAGAVGADIVGSEDVELYCSGKTLADLSATYLLAPATSPNVRIRVPSFEFPDLFRRVAMPPAVVAADLADSADGRTRRAGLELLAAQLVGLRK